MPSRTVTPVCNQISHSYAWGAGVSKVYEGTSKGLATVARGVETGVKGVGRLFVEEAPDALTAYNSSVSAWLCVAVRGGVFRD